MSFRPASAQSLYDAVVPPLLVVSLRGTAATWRWKLPSEPLACSVLLSQWPWQDPGAGPTKCPWCFCFSDPCWCSALRLAVWSPVPRARETTLDPGPAQAFGIPQGVLMILPMGAGSLLKSEQPVSGSTVPGLRAAQPPSSWGTAHGMGALGSAGPWMHIPGCGPCSLSSPPAPPLSARTLSRHSTADSAGPAGQSHVLRWPLGSVYLRRYVS